MGPIAHVGRSVRLVRVHMQQWPVEDTHAHLALLFVVRVGVPLYEGTRGVSVVRHASCLGVRAAFEWRLLSAFRIDS